MNSMAKSIRVAMLLAALASSGPLREARGEEDVTFGAWAVGQSAPGNLLATHATLLRNNKILVAGGSSYNCCFKWGKEEARLYDIASGAWSSPLASPAPYGSDKDAFCSGHSHDHAGGVIFQGGLVSYVNNGHGIADSARYDPAGGGWTQLTGAAAHWYPTLVTGVGHTFIFPGVNTQPGTKTAEGNQIQKLPYGESAWSSTGVSMDTLGTYPRVSLLPDGKLFVASPASTTRKNYTFDPMTNTVVPAGNDVVPESEPGMVHGSSDSWKGTGVLLPLVPTGNNYPRMRFAMINGVQAYVKDLGQPNPTWQPLGTRPPNSGLRRRGARSPIRRFCRPGRYS